MRDSFRCDSFNHVSTGNKEYVLLDRRWLSDLFCGCDFDTKLRHAYDIGASALIVVDTNKDKNPVTMSTSIQEDDENDRYMRQNVTAVTIEPDVIDSFPLPNSEGMISNSFRLLYFDPASS